MSSLDFYLILLIVFIISYLLLAAFQGYKKIQIIIITILGINFIALGLYQTGRFVSYFGKDYTYENAPENIKVLLNQFISEATKRNIDVKDIYTIKIKYLPWNFNSVYYEGACNIKTKTLLIPSKTIDSLTIFHELGHCILGYEHTANDNKYKKEIMFPYHNEEQKLTSDSLNNFFNEERQRKTNYNFLLSFSFLDI